eukprot:CAMPEP_0196721058 /NCGR_PEP_ID=MMETSP1091-20130531/3721_1 /TAXON_ID=302021 /ORGANISM="Rhodomonas sp., Strain CCMP768" /LENGTH=47 /DNA_ID= /DNA_START= /DNA_END= /DNA_ORIENTATION=
MQPSTLAQPTKRLLAAQAVQLEVSEDEEEGGHDEQRHHLEPALPALN